MRLASHPRIWLALVVLGALVGPSAPKAAATEEADVDRYFVASSEVSTKTGPQVITRNILQDRNGDYWLATWNGLVRYDGKAFTNVTNQEGLRRYRTFCLLEDHKGHIWVGTTGAGVYRYDGKSYTNFTTKDGLVDDTVLWMMEDRDHNIWIGGMGLTKFDGKTFTAFDETDGFTRKDVHSIEQAPDGSLWIGTRGALFHYDGKTFVDFTQKHGVDIQHTSYTPAVVDRLGHVWFGGSKGMYHYDGVKVRHVFQPACFSLMEDSKGHIWFTGGALEGQEPRPGVSVFNRFDPAAGVDNLLKSRKQIEVPSGAIFGLTEDRDGSIWFGTGRGVGRLQGETAFYFTGRQP